MEAAYNFKEMMNKPERLAPGHRMCAGCGGTIAVRGVLRALHEGDRAVVGNATGCLEVSSLYCQVIFLIKSRNFKVYISGE